MLENPKLSTLRLFPPVSSFNNSSSEQSACCSCESESEDVSPLSPFPFSSLLARRYTFFPVLGTSHITKAYNAGHGCYAYQFLTVMAIKCPNDWLFGCDYVI